jgi:hypothetical protein
MVRKIADYLVLFAVANVIGIVAAAVVFCAGMALDIDRATLGDACQITIMLVAGAVLASGRNS